MKQNKHEHTINDDEISAEEIPDETIGTEIPEERNCDSKSCAIGAISVALLKPHNEIIGNGGRK